MFFSSEFVPVELDNPKGDRSFILWAYSVGSALAGELLSPNLAQAQAAYESARDERSTYVLGMVMISDRVAIESGVSREKARSMIFPEKQAKAIAPAKNGSIVPEVVGKEEGPEKKLIDWIKTKEEVECLITGKGDLESGPEKVAKFKYQQAVATAFFKYRAANAIEIIALEQTDETFTLVTEPLYFAIAKGEKLRLASLLSGALIDGLTLKADSACAIGSTRVQLVMNDRIQELDDYLSATSQSGDRLFGLILQGNGEPKVGLRWGARDIEQLGESHLSSLFRFWLDERSGKKHRPVEARHLAEQYPIYEDPSEAQEAMSDLAAEANGGKLRETSKPSDKKLLVVATPETN